MVRQDRAADHSQGALLLGDLSYCGPKVSVPHPVIWFGGRMRMNNNRASAFPELERGGGNWHGHEDELLEQTERMILLRK